MQYKFQVNSQDHRELLDTLLNDRKKEQFENALLTIAKLAGMNPQEDIMTIAIECPSLRRM